MYLELCQSQWFVHMSGDHGVRYRTLHAGGDVERSMGVLHTRGCCLNSGVCAF